MINVATLANGRNVNNWSDFFFVKVFRTERVGKEAGQVNSDDVDDYDDGNDENDDDGGDGGNDGEDGDDGDDGDNSDIDFDAAASRFGFIGWLVWKRQTLLLEGSN